MKSDLEEEGSSEADARSIAAQNLSDLECGDDATGSPVASPSNAAIDRQGGVPGSIHTSGGSRGCRSAPGSRSSSRTPNRTSAAPPRASRSKPNSRSNSRSRSKDSGTTTPDEINAERERRRIEALAMIREVDSRRNVLDLGPAMPPPTASSSTHAGNGGGGMGVGASIRNLFGSPSTTKKPRATSNKKRGAKTVSETLAVHAGQWGGAAPYSSSAAAKGNRNAAANANQGRAIASSIDEMMISGMGLDVADACDPSPGMFESIRAFNMAGNGGANGDDENEYDDDYNNDGVGGTKRKWKFYNVNEIKRTCSRNGVMITLGVFVAAAVAFVALICVSSMQQPSSNGNAQPDDAFTETTIPTTDPPQRPPPLATASAPKPPSIATGRLQVFMDVAVSTGITPAMDVFADPSSPQYRAAVWITNALPLDMDYHGGNVPDLMQRYGIATFLLSTQPVDSTAELHEQEERDDGDGAPYNGSEDNAAAMLLSDDDVCDWDGIACDGTTGLVNSIDLPASGLKGTLPYELFSSTQNSLESIVLNDNELSGTFPESIALMDNLVTLDLSENNIGSTLPPALFGLPSLTDLTLSNNWFEGQLPSTDGDAAPLSKLILHSNYLTGTVDGLGGLQSLEVLDVNSNSLHVSGELGSSLFGLSNLSFLRLSNNHLSGTLSSDIGQLTNLGTLSLDGTSTFEGPCHR